MIVRLRGKLIEKQPTRVVIECAGVGYEALVSTRCCETLPPVGSEATLLTHLVTREDAQTLFGFSGEAEKADFLALLKVPGVGAKTALSTLSILSHEELSAAVEQGDAKALARAPGVGAKTAARMLAELKGRIASAAATSGEAPGPAGGNRASIIAALVSLGYREKEAYEAAKKIDPSLDVAEGIRQALRHFGPQA